MKFVEGVCVCVALSIDTPIIVHSLEHKTSCRFNQFENQSILKSIFATKFNGLKPCNFFHPESFLLLLELTKTHLCKCIFFRLHYATKNKIWKWNHFLDNFAEHYFARVMISIWIGLVKKAFCNGFSLCDVKENVEEKYYLN